MSLLADGNPIVWVEIPTADLVRAKRFYEAIFDIGIQDFDAGELRFGCFPMQQGEPNGAVGLVNHQTI